MPIPPLSRGFSNPTEEEESSVEQESKPSEEVDASDNQTSKYPKITKTNKNKCDKRVRRGGDCKNKYMNNKCATTLKVFSANCASLRNGKLASLNAGVKATKANIVTLQETHYKEKGKIKLDRDLVVFEAIRVKKGGGTAIAIHKDLKPKLIEEHNDDFELLVVEVKTNEKEIRIISGYGPQENWEEDKRLPFFLAMETAIERAELAGKSIFIECDANSKLGKQYIPKDPHAISPNGRLLADIIDRRNLIVCNGTEKCTGAITRKRVTRKTCEQSAIDVVLISNDLKQHLESMHIDENRKYVLSKIYKAKTGVKVKESDHNTIITEFNLKLAASKDEKKIEVYNLRNKECQAKFKEYTSKTKMLSSIFDNNSDNINDLTNRSKRSMVV